MYPQPVGAKCAPNVEQGKVRSLHLQVQKIQHPSPSVHLLWQKKHNYDGSNTCGVQVPVTTSTVATLTLLH